jgi:hypothetical protein
MEMFERRVFVIVVKGGMGDVPVFEVLDKVDGEEALPTPPLPLRMRVSRFFIMAGLVLVHQQVPLRRFAAQLFWLTPVKGKMVWWRTSWPSPCRRFFQNIAAEMPDGGVTDFNAVLLAQNGDDGTVLRRT